MKKILTALVSVSLLAACSETTVVVGPSPAPSVAATPSPSPTAVPAAPDGALDYKAITGYQIVEGAVDLSSVGKDDELKLMTVIKSQAELDKYLKPAAGVTPEATDFTKNYLLLTAKVTGANSYQGKITGLNMSGGDLLADYEYSISYSSDPMLNDFIRPVISVTRFERLTYNQLKVTSRAAAGASPSPSPSASPTS